MNIQPIFKNMGGRISGNLDNSTKISNSGIYLPTYIGIEDDKIKEICKTIENFLTK